MDGIEKLIKQESWYLQCWDDRYGQGIWAIIGPVSGHVDAIRDITEGGDVQAEALSHYLNDKGDWLPAALGDSIISALAALNEKVKDLTDNETWKNAVYNAFERITEVNDGELGIKIAVEFDNEAVFIAPEGMDIYRHLATNFDDTEDAVYFFKKRTNIDIEGKEIVKYDISDLEIFNKETGRTLLEEIKHDFLAGRKENKFVILRYDSITNIFHFDSELYRIITKNAYIIQK